MQSLFLTRTRYLNGLVCPKMLWLRVNGREAFGESAVRPQAVENSRSVLALARGLFEPVLTVEHGEYAAMEKETARLIKEAGRSIGLDGKSTVIAHAALSVRDCHCIIDFLVLREDGAAEIYMVKGALHVNAAAREDLAYQYTVCRMAGLCVKKAAVLTVSRDYVRGEEAETDASRFFRENDLTAETEKKMSSVRETIAKLRIYMLEEREPVRTLSEGCFSPYDCPAFSYCARFLPEPNVFRLSATQLADKMKLYEKGLVSFPELAEGGFENLSDSARLQILCELENRPLLADRDAVREFLDSLWKPLYFLDFEAFQPPVPKYPGTRPFETIVFQYSVHAEDVNVHGEFLGDPSEDPRRALAEKLVSDIPENACILTYNSSYEKKRIEELARLFPDLSESLTKLRSNIVDLMPLFSSKKVYDRRMQGSYSLKAVLPALFPDDPALDYKNLPGVRSGGEAADAFFELERLEGEEKEKLRMEMLRYCALDTRAMVKIVEKLRSVAADDSLGGSPGGD